MTASLEVSRNATEAARRRCPGNSALSYSRHHVSFGQGQERWSTWHTLWPAGKYHPVDLPSRSVDRARIKAESASRALSGLLAEVPNVARQLEQAAATLSISTCLSVSELSHLVATRTVGRDEFTSAPVDRQLVSKMVIHTQK